MNIIQKWKNNKLILKKYNIVPPIEFMCPTSNKLMNNPIQLLNGNSYDKKN